MEISFVDFVKTLPENEDRGIVQFKNFLMEHPELLPKENNCKQIAEAIYKHLDQESTSAFQKLCMVYSTVNPQSHASFGGLDGINHIITLQTNDMDYPFYREIPAHPKNR